MNKRVIYPLIGFVLVLILHAGYSIRRAYDVAAKWVRVEEADVIAEYFKNGDFFLSLSYAAAVSFTIYAFLKLKEKKRAGAVGVASGLTLVGLLYFGVCFLLGCCGSPMLVVYLGLFGPKFLGFTKPLVFIITVISIIAGVFWLEKSSTKCINGKCVRGADEH